MTRPNSLRSEIWFAAGVTTPFAKVDGALGRFDAIALSVPVVRRMIDPLRGALPEFAVWGAVIPNLAWSNIAREVLMDAGVNPGITAFSTIMACATSMIGAIEAARSEEHTSELQSRLHLVCRLLLEKK